MPLPKRPRDPVERSKLIFDMNVALCLAGGWQRTPVHLDGDPAVAGHCAPSRDTPPPGPWGCKVRHSGHRRYRASYLQAAVAHPARRIVRRPRRARPAGLLRQQLHHHRSPVGHHLSPIAARARNDWITTIHGDPLCPHPYSDIIPGRTLKRSTSCCSSSRATAHQGQENAACRVSNGPCTISGQGHPERTFNARSEPPHSKHARLPRTQLWPRPPVRQRRDRQPHHRGGQGVMDSSTSTTAPCTAASGGPTTK